MKVKLRLSRVANINGRPVPQKIGDVIDVDELEAQRLIDASHAEPVKTRQKKVETATDKTKTK